MQELFMARSHGLVVKGDDLQSRDCGFESRRRILDGSKRCYSYYFIKKITKIKVAKWGTPKKKKNFHLKHFLNQFPSKF
jgi:hypothetical protein